MGLLDGKVVLITGAGRGVGRGHALLCAAQGARVVVNDPGASVSGGGIDQAPADEVVEVIRQRSGEAIADYNDISSWDGSSRAIQAAISAFGDLHGLVNNAGVIRPTNIADATEEDFDSVVRVHLKGTFCCTRHACNYWRSRFEAGERRQRSIVNTVSDAMIFALTDPAYGAAKAGIAQLTLSNSHDAAPYLVRVNATAPRAATRMSMASPMMKYSDDAKIVEAENFDATSPANPANSSPLVAWLLSDEAAHVSGQVFRTLAGAFARCEPWRADDLQWPSGGRMAFTPEEIGPAMNKGVFRSTFMPGQLDFAPGDPRGLTT
ncbi:MAG TPA: SDR family NAD(P)-dependent oxidoreductase [Sphingobium sp.]|uniref:SDR family NAD(P)-dependent oxidoreductase n=1 Tax=Sphingobium sp. TaxID=1912891 RepID=UPI002ED2D35C